MVLSGVGGHTHLAAVEGEAGVADAVGEPADGGSGAREAAEVRREGILAEKHVREVPVAVRGEDLGDGGAVVHRPDLHAGLVAEGVDLDLTAVRELPEGFGPGALEGGSGWVGGTGAEQEAGKESQQGWRTARDAGGEHGVDDAGGVGWGKV